MRAFLIFTILFSSVIATSQPEDDHLDQPTSYMVSFRYYKKGRLSDSPRVSVINDESSNITVGDLDVNEAGDAVAKENREFISTTVLIKKSLTDVKLVNAKVDLVDRHQSGSHELHTNLTVELGEEYVIGGNTHNGAIDTVLIMRVDKN